MPVERFNTTLQENVITLLAHSDQHGKVVMALVEPELFEGDYRTIATRLITYWQQFSEAPKIHTADLFDDILGDQHNRKANTFRRILVNMVALSESINTDYVIDTCRTFARMQRIEAAILQSAEQLHAKKEHAIGDIEGIWNELLRGRAIDFDAGVRLSDFDRMLDYLGRQYSEFKSGVKILDDRNIVPYRDGVMLWLGAAGLGKSWALVNVGDRALKQRKRVLHVTLEMAAEEVMQRYYQCRLAISKRDIEVQLPQLVLGSKKGDIDDVTHEPERPKLSFESPYIRDELETQVSLRRPLYHNLLIIGFPPRSVTPDMLRGVLDNVEVVEKFIPDMIILDYIGIMKTDAKNHRISLGRVAEEFRAICVERHVAGVTAHQISKQGAEALHARSIHVAEDWSLIATHDQVITYSSTDSEHQLGLARLFVSKARSEEDKFGAVITQSYPTGQFCLNSAYFKPAYFELLAELSKRLGQGNKNGTATEEEDEGEEE